VSVYIRHEWHKGPLFPHGFSGVAFEFCVFGRGGWPTGARSGVARQRRFISSTNYSRLECGVESEWTDRELYLAGRDNIRVH